MASLLGRGVPASFAAGLLLAASPASAAAPLYPDLFCWSQRGKYGLFDAEIVVVGGRKRLRFTTAVANRGRGPFQLEGAVDGDGTTVAYQRVFYDDGSFQDRPAGTFQFSGHEGHNHFHFAAFAAYNLRAVAAGNALGAVLARSPKVGFAMWDVAPYDKTLPGAPQSGFYTRPGAVDPADQTQGISVGWADVYERTLGDQYVDVTGLADGTYWLEVVVDPEGRLAESDESNNRTWMKLAISGTAVTTFDGQPGAAPPPGAAFLDAFAYPDGLITNENPASPRSASWLVTEGSLFASGGQGWTGAPDAAAPDAASSNGTGSALFRALTQRSDFATQVDLKLTVQRFVSVLPANPWDGAHVFLRYQDAANYYQVSVQRRDGRAAIKKRRGGTVSTFTTPLVSAPLGVPRAVRAAAVNNPDGSVTIELHVNGALAARAVDAGAPITAAGRVGVAGENVEFRFDDVAIGGTAPPPPPPSTAFSDSFPYPDGLITNENPASPRSAKWLVTEGSLFAAGGRGWTGVPDGTAPDAASSNGTGSAVFRALTQAADPATELSFKLTVDRFVSVLPANAWDGAHVLLRYQDAANYYWVSIHRRDGRAAIKKRRFGAVSTFATPLYSPPLGVSRSARVSAVNNPDGSVTIALYVDGTLVARAVDAASPITAPGRAGMAGENVEFHFDDFALGGAAAGPASLVSGAAPDSFGLRDVYVFPNPSRRGQRPTFRVQVGLADAVSLNIYDVSGRLVHSAGLGAPAVLDDGNGKGPQYTFEYPWDAGAAGSGVYIGVVTARKAGHPALRNVTRLAVIK